jgi:hypothetical protein
MFYADTVLNGSVHAFECGYKFFGPDHIVFATDYPFGPRKGERWIEGALHQIEMSSLPSSEKDQILGGNSDSYREDKDMNPYLTDTRLNRGEIAVRIIRPEIWE